MKRIKYSAEKTTMVKVSTGIQTCRSAASKMRQLLSRPCANGLGPKNALQEDPIQLLGLASLCRPQQYAGTD